MPEFGVSTFHIGENVYKYTDSVTAELLKGKVDKVAGKELSTNDFTNTYKDKLDGIAAEAEKNPPMDAALSDSSVYPVQNKAIKSYIDTKVAEANTLATTTVAGKVIVGDNLTVENGRLSAGAPYQLPPATSAFAQDPVLGGVMAGASIEVENGVIDVAPATNLALGGVIVGEGLSITAAGVLSATGGGGGSVVKEDLYINSGTTQESTITLSDDYDKYDILYFTIISNSNKIISSIETSKIEVNDILQITEDNTYEVTSKTVFAFTSTPSANSYLESVVGIGLGGGGSRGASSLNELSDVTISNPTDGQILKYDDQNDIWVNEDLNTGINYSTTEQVIGTWIDGKPLYQKTIATGSLPASGTTTVALNISDIDNIIRYEGFASDGTNFVNLPLVSITPSAIIDLYCDRTNMHIYASNRSAYSGYVTIQYTKTTDNSN